MAKFKVGDKVVRTRGSYGNVYEGGVYSVSRVKDDNKHIELEGEDNTYGYWVHAFELVEPYTEKEHSKFTLTRTGELVTLNVTGSLSKKQIADIMEIVYE